MGEFGDMKGSEIREYDEIKDKTIKFLEMRETQGGNLRYQMGKIF